MKSRNYIIKELLFLFGIVSVIGSIIWTLTKPGDTWLWFSRLCAGMVFLGISVLIDILTKIQKNGKA